MPSGFEQDLIFDVGMHNGTDSEFYLKKGFRVVAIEANPSLAEEAAARLREYVERGAALYSEPRGRGTGWTG